ncbi:MAG: enoyl-CoA hydratase/isomerase family protein [Burkholderiales bacterium]|nr:enoyl-CoA hydratase/isomerase family protein [Burkholderiales bacterium]MDE2453552.1 enoyl-CoA hydratase/isomerase family protein [Burkholderiales bacterium]
MAGDEAPGQPPSLAIDGVIATITLRRPAVANRLARADLDALQAQIAEVDARPEVRVLRLQGAGRHFCAGFDIREVGIDGEDAGQRFEALAGALEDARPVTIAAIQGGAYGGAVDLALACDFRVASTVCEMRIPAARLGLLFYRGGLERLVTRLGLAAAKRLLLAAETLDASALREIGLVDRIVGADALADEVDAMSRKLAAMAPLAMLPMKKHLNAIARSKLDADELARDIAVANSSDDLREGSRAWQDKRTPDFKGR